MVEEVGWVMTDKTKEQLEQALAEAREVMEFYASESSWRPVWHECPDRHFINYSDYSFFDNEPPVGLYLNRTVGGRRAREWLEKWGG